MSYSLIQLFLLHSHRKGISTFHPVLVLAEYFEMSRNPNQASILLVDDSTTNIALLEAIFEEKGYQIIKAQSISDALSSISRRIPDLILLDLLFPKVSGFDFFEHLQKNEETRHIPVIVISALSDKESENRALKMGAVDFISKPIDIAYLAQKVESVLNQ